MAEENNIGGEVKMRVPDEYSQAHHSQLGVILGVLIVVLVIILGGLYLWGSSLTKDAPVAPVIENNEPETTRAKADVQILQTTSSSDEIDAIEADLNSTNLESLGSEIDDIDREYTATVPQQ